MTKWVTKKLGEIGDIISGGTPATNNDAYWDGDIPFVTPLDLGREKVIDKTIRNVTELGLANSSANKIKANSLAMSTRAPIGLMSIVKNDFSTNQGCKSIQFHEDQDPEFHYYNLSYNVEKIKRYGQGTTFMEISKTDFSSLEFLVPESLAEQRRIAGILSSADGAIAASEALIAKYRNIKRGLLTTLLQPKEGWKKVKLGECAQINRGGSPRPIDAFVTDSEDGINWIKIGDIAPNGKYVNTTSEKIIPEGKQHSREVHKGDFILSNSMSFGRPYILNIEGCIHDGWLAIQDYEDTFDTDFLYYMLSSDIVKKQYLAMASGSTVLNLNKEKVAKVILTIPFTSEGTPDLMEQKHIASILSSIDAKINIEEDVVEKYKGVKNGLMEELLKSNE